MQTCKYIDDCAFYNNRLEVMPSETNFMKSFFCRKNQGTAPEV
jgi:hypothetical protein